MYAFEIIGYLAVLLVLVPKTRPAHFALSMSHWLGPGTMVLFLVVSLTHLPGLLHLRTYPVVGHFHLPSHQGMNSEIASVNLIYKFL